MASVTSSETHSLMSLFVPTLIHMENVTVLNFDLNTTIMADYNFISFFIRHL